jgi:putative transposase
MRDGSTELDLPRRRLEVLGLGLEPHAGLDGFVNRPVERGDVVGAAVGIQLRERCGIERLRVAEDSTEVRTVSGIADASRRGLLCTRERAPKMKCAFIAERCSDLPVVTCCRVMEVPTSTYYAWRANPLSDRDRADADLTNTLVDIHRQSRGTYGSPRVHAELRLGQNIRVSRKRVERLMRQAGLAGIYRRRSRGCTRRDQSATPSDDLVKRHFSVDAPDRLWVMDISEHPTDEGKVYVAVVLDAWSRRVIGWSIADHIRAELVVDALQMAVWRRRPDAGTIAHSDHGSQPRFNRSTQHRLVAASVGVRRGLRRVSSSRGSCEVCC